jgi:alcohol dehydrogenase class IV
VLGLAHAVALALSHLGHNHGILVAVAMPAVLRFLQKHAGPKIGRIEAYLGLDLKDDLASFVERLNGRICLPVGFGQMGFKEKDLDTRPWTSARACIRESEVAAGSIGRGGS